MAVIERSGPHSGLEVGMESRRVRRGTAPRLFLLPLVAYVQYATMLWNSDEGFQDESVNRSIAFKSPDRKFRSTELPNSPDGHISLFSWTSKFCTPRFTAALKIRRPCLTTG